MSKSLEDLEQEALVSWAATIPLLPHDLVLPRQDGSRAKIGDYLFAVPLSGGYRHTINPATGARYSLEGQRMKRMGAKPGVTDMVLPLPFHGYGQLFVELKRPARTFKTLGEANRAVNADQIEWARMMRRAGYAAVFCWGWDQAREIIEHYVVPDRRAEFEGLYRVLCEPAGGAKRAFLNH